MKEKREQPFKGADRVWQGLLVKLENKLQRAGQDEKLQYDFILSFAMRYRYVNFFRFNQNGGI